MTEYCPVLRPTFEEFIHPKEYIKSIESIVFKHGICKIIPPPSWNPRHSIQCLCGPGNFMNACKHKASGVNVNDNDNQNTNTNKFGFEKGLLRYDTNRFGSHMSPDNYVKLCNNITPECLCSFNNIFGDDTNDSLFNIHTNHTESCPYIRRIYNKNNNTHNNNNYIYKSDNNNNNKSDSYYPKSFNELLNKV
eukprot:43148_1